MLKYILDIESVIQEIELIKAKTENGCDFYHLSKFS